MKKMEKDLKALDNQHLFCENAIHELNEDLQSFDNACVSLSIINNNVTESSD